MARVLKAFLHGIVAFFIAGIASCALFTWMVQNSPDGQAGMGAAFGGFYVACLAAVISFITSLVRDRRRRD
jgi:membrane associated rhomboid family serine protease